MIKTLRAMLLLLAFLFAATNLCAQKESEKLKFNVAGDIVSSYVWRGQYQTGASIQPTLGLSAGAFSFTVWGSTDFIGAGHKEVDLTAAYTIKGLTVSVADLWWGGQGAEKYFMFENNRTQHIFEAGLSYTLSPITLSWYTMFAGGDHNLTKTGKSKQAYSTYIEASYPFSVRGVDLQAALGVSPWESQMQYGNDGFAVTNIAFKASKTIQVTERFSLPIYSQVIWNPNKEDVHLVLGITLR